MNFMMLHLVKPFILGVAKILFIPKDSASANVSEMRPISLLCVTSKLFERLLLPRFLKLIVPKLSRYQFVFLKDLSAIDALNLLKKRIHDCLSRSSKGKPFLFLDIKKANDGTWIKALSHKMMKMGLPPFYIKIINIWLENRFVYAKSGTKQSSWYRILRGLPQGGVLCCILWAIFINDLPECVKLLCECLLFADDVQLSALKGGQEGISQLQAATVAVCRWANKWRVAWSVIKSVFMCVNIRVPAPFTLYGIVLKEVAFVKYLGIIYSNDGTWNLHWESKITKAKQVSNLIQKFAVNSSVTVPAAFIALLCRQVLQSMLFYGFPVWSPPESQFSSADNIVIKPFSKAIGCPWNAGSNVCLTEAGLMPTVFFWDYSALQYGHQFFRLRTTKRIGSAEVLNEYNAKICQPLVRGVSPFGSFLKWLEKSWGVSLVQLNKNILKKSRHRMFKKFLHTYNCTSSLALLQLRRSLFTKPGYLFLPHVYAACIFRFRINYGPDIHSLQRRGLLKDSSNLCRLCNKSVETRLHLLCECSATRKKTPPIWKDKNISFFISDSMHDEEDYFRIAGFSNITCLVRFVM